MENSPQILVYITENKDGVISGDPLTLLITDEKEKQQCVRDLSIALRTEVAQLKNGDYILITK